MNNLNQQICNRLIKSCSKAKADLLKLCQLKLMTIKDKSALLIHCPNAWTADRINESLIGNLDLVLHSMGINQAVLDDGEGLKSYYQWDLTNFSFKGYFTGESLNKLEIVNIPNIEELENMTGN
jgi:hypothetical protein